jgi:hypothetical protein
MITDPPAGEYLSPDRYVQKGFRFIGFLSARIGFGKMNDRAGSRAVSKIATPNNCAASCGVLIFPRERDKIKIIRVFRCSSSVVSVYELLIVAKHNQKYKNKFKKKKILPRDRSREASNRFEC